MTSGGLARLYAVLVAVTAFLVTWAAVAAHPWRESKSDPRLTALAERRARLQHEAAHARHVLARRYAAYRVALAERERRIAHVRAEQTHLDAVAANAWARYRASTPVRTITVTTPVAATPHVPAQSTAQPAVLASASVPSPAPAPTPPPAPAPVAAPAPPVVSIPPVTASQTS